MTQSAPVTVEDLTAAWLDEKCQRLNASSRATYYQAVTKYIVPLIGALNINTLGREQLQGFVNQLFALGLSEKTVWDVNVKLNAALHWAVDRGYLDHAGYCIKTRFHLSDSVRTLSESEQNILEAYLSEADRVKIGVLLCLKCGVMVGEVCALSTSDIDLDQGVLKISRRLQRVVNTERTSGRKTRIEIFPLEERRVPLNRQMIDLIRRLPPAAPDSYFLTGRTDKCVEPRVLQMRLKSFLNGCGLDSGIAFHVLKATYISSSIHQGTDLYTVGRRVGAKRLSHISDKYRAFSHERTPGAGGPPFAERE